jgi:hypothetical protein
VPVTLGVFTGTFRDAEGNVVGGFTEPAETKGNGKQKADATCSISIFEVSDGSDPDGPPKGFTFTGSATGTFKITKG